jgi:cytochrome c-type biogenesis protein
MEVLQHLVDNSNFPLLTAFFLGLMTAISPCPLATNISAIGFISKDIQDKRRIFFNGLLYTLGRVISYTVLATILIILLKQGSSIFKLQRVISKYGELLIGPILILIGVFMLDFIRIRLSSGNSLMSKMETKASNGKYWSTLLLGMVFALAFCPYSGVLYFGALLPLSVSSPAGYFLPVIFAIATGLPVILFAWIIAFSMSSLGNFYQRLKTFEFWFRRVTAVIFILVGIYYCWMVYF